MEVVVTIDIQQLNQKLALRYRDAGFDMPDPFTLELTWMVSMLTNQGNDPFPPQREWHLIIAKSDPRETPWGEHLRALQPNRELPAVLLVGRLGSNRMLIDSGLVGRIVRSQGLKNHRTVCCNTLETFWPNFFNSRQFITDPSHIPSLIISPGFSKVEDEAGTSYQIDVQALLEKIGESWNIPVVIASTRAPT